MPYELVAAAAKLDWVWDWSDWLAPGDSIDTRLWTIDPTHGDSPLTPTLFNITAETVTVEGLIAGKVYRLTEHVVTLGGLEDERSIMLRCEAT